MISIGEGLKDAKEECFVILLCDGIPLAIAYQRAGFPHTQQAALALFRSARIQARIQAVFEARARTPGLGLPEITDMLKRVYANALHDTEYSAAHNAAFSLARLHGLIIDRAQLDVIRRPSREPDAPVELALGAWVEALPSPPAGPRTVSRETGVVSEPIQRGPLIEGTTYGCDLDQGPGAIENGAPFPPVTETPPAGGHSEPLAERQQGTGIFPRAEDLF